MSIENILRQRRRQAAINICKIIAARLAVLALALVMAASALSYIPKPIKQEVIAVPEEVMQPQVEILKAPVQKIVQCVTGYPVVDWETWIKSHDWSGEQEEILLRLGTAEAGGEGVECIALVILCFLNRVWSSEFPNTFEEVLYATDQFTPIRDGRYYTVEICEDAYKAMELIKSGWDPSLGCMWFESCKNESDRKWHEENLILVYEVGNMRFYRDWTQDEAEAKAKYKLEKDLMRLMAEEAHS